MTPWVLVVVLAVLWITSAMKSAALQARLDRLEARQGGVGAAPSGPSALDMGSTGLGTPGSGLSAAGAAGLSSGDAELEVRRLVREGKKIEAIKLYRSAVGCDLKTAKDAVDRMG